MALSTGSILQHIPGPWGFSLQQNCVTGQGPEGSLGLEESHSCARFAAVLSKHSVRAPRKPEWMWGSQVSVPIMCIKPASEGELGGTMLPSLKSSIVF